MSTPVATLSVDEASVQFRDYLANPAQFPDPYPMYRAIRDVEPVHWSEVGMWFVLGAPEGREMFRLDQLSRRRFAEGFAQRFDDSTPEARGALDVWLSHFINMDAPQHGKVRGLVSHAFSPKAVRRWEDVIVQVVHDAVVGIADRDEFDLLHDFAYRIPSMVTADMVGVPRSDHRLFEEWTTAWLNSAQVSDPRANLRTASTRPLEEFVDYLRALVAGRRAEGADREDLVSMLLNAEESGRHLGEDELLGALMLLIIAGHETTANVIGNGALSLLRNPDQFDLLRADPELVTSAVEEVLRYENPARSVPRVAVEDVPLGDVVIREGQTIQVHTGAVNRDPRVFDQPDRLDITRKENHHLAFGAGVHFCIGLHVARLEARHTFRALAVDVPRLEIAGDIEWRNGHVRGLVALPVRRV